MGIGMKESDLYISMDRFLESQDIILEDSIIYLFLLLQVRRGKRLLRKLRI